MKNISTKIYIVHDNHTINMTTSDRMEWKWLQDQETGNNNVKLNRDCMEMLDELRVYESIQKKTLDFTHCHSTHGI